MSTLPKREGASIHSVDHFCMTVPNLDVAARFFEDFGLQVARVAHGLELRTQASEHCWAKIHEGDTKALQYVALGIFPEDESTFRERLSQSGRSSEPHRLGPTDGLWCCAPGGLQIVLRVAEKTMPDAKSSAPEHIAPAGVAGTAGRASCPPVHPGRLSHLAFFTPSLDEAIEFCIGTLGMRLSDRSDHVAFLHGAHGSDHHLLAFARSAASGLHHSSWDVASVNEVGWGGERMKAAGHDRGWGVGRHCLGSNYFYYVRDPWGSYAEYSYDIDFIESGQTWQAGFHPSSDSMYLWGPEVPAEFVTNHEAASSGSGTGDTSCA